MKDTKGYVYFVIKTENESFGIKEFESFLTIKPTEFNRMFEKGNSPVCTSWKFSSGNLTNPFYYQEIEKLMDSLEKHKDEFIKLKTEMSEFNFSLSIVMFLGDETPGLNFSKRTLSFMNELHGDIDCDIYNEK